MLQQSSATLIDTNIHFGDATYRYVLAAGEWELFGETIESLEADLLLVVADTGIPQSFLSVLVSTCQKSTRTAVYSIARPEASKRLEVIAELAQRAIDSGATRRSVVLGLGGGSVGNIAGLLASLLYRGVRLVHVPTTLLAASDSTLSLKQAINLSCGKNLLGAYHSPVLVWADLECLSTLSYEHVKPALCEAAKNVLVIAPSKISWFRSLEARKLLSSTNALVDFLQFCIAAKSKVMESDPQERGAGLVLEYGHTAAHAIEKASMHTIQHGEAVALGMIVAAKVSAKLGYAKSELILLHLELLSRIGAPTTLNGQVALEDVLQFSQTDNKRGIIDVRPSEMPMILLSEAGSVLRDLTGLPIVGVARDVFESSLNEVLKPS